MMDNFDEDIRQDTPEKDGTQEKYLTFQISTQHYGIGIDDVIEIVQIQPTTELPELPYYVKGIINLRGRVLPLIDMNLRFGKPEREYTDRTCIIIIGIGGVQVGLIVDAVEEVLDIADAAISPPPAFSSDISARYIIGIAKLEKIMVLLLNSHLLLSELDMGMVEQANLL